MVGWPSVKAVALAMSSTAIGGDLRNVYEFGLTGAGTRTAGFAIAAVVATDRRHRC
jgi:hypothetical protein